MDFELWAKFFEPNSTYSGGCILWTGYRDNLGYGRTKRYNGEIKVHRIAWTLAKGPIPNGLCVLHRCDVRHCINPQHLFIGTQQDNIADMRAKGRAKNPVPQFGEDNPMSALSEEDVLAIRRLCREKKQQQNIVAKRFGVSPMTVSRIVNNQLWRHI